MEAARRTFIALWPSPRLAARMHAAGSVLRLQLPGKLLCAADLHLTLAFLGPLTAEQRQQLLPALQVVSAPALRLRLDRFSYWPHNRIGWLGPSQPSAALQALAWAVQQAASSAGCPPTDARFTPHITLLRHGPPGPAPALPELPAVEWPVNEWVLAASRLGVGRPRYEVLQRFALQPSTEAAAQDCAGQRAATK